MILIDILLLHHYPQEGIHTSCTK